MIRDNKDNILGANNSDNQFDSSAVVANRDGSLIERVEYMMNPGEGSSVSKVLATTALGATTIFNFTGIIRIKSIVGVVTTVMENKATTIKLGVFSDSLAGYDICTTKDVDTFAVGSLLSITGTAANALLSTTAVGAIAPGQANVVTASCIAAGAIKVTSGAANTGAITWSILWEAVTPGATVTAA